MPGLEGSATEGGSKAEIWHWLDHWLGHHLTGDCLTSHFLVTGTSLSPATIRRVAVDFVHAGLVSRILDLLPVGILHQGGDLGFDGPLDYVRELDAHDPFTFEALFDGRAAWGGPQLALGGTGRALLIACGLEFGDTHGSGEKAVRRRGFLLAAAERLETVGGNRHLMEVQRSAWVTARYRPSRIDSPDAHRPPPQQLPLATGPVAA